MTDEENEHTGEERSPPRSFVSFYSKQTRNNECEFHVDHPNHLGTSVETGQAAEKARLTRSRAPFISKEFHLAALGKCDLRSTFFRLRTSKSFLQQCRDKQCFRRDAKRVEPPPKPLPIHEADDSIRYFMHSSAVAVKNAADVYGQLMMDDVQLGFTSSFAVSAQIPDLPFVANVSSSSPGPPEASVLSLVLSYRHSTTKKGRILNIEPERWPSLLETVRMLCRKARCTHFRLWTDQMLSSRKPEGSLRWVSSGILPYTMHPVLYIPVTTSSISADLRRMWISIEHLVASLGQGIIHPGPPLPTESLPLEWLTMHTEVESGDTRATWMTGLNLPAHAVVRRLCGAIMCGLVRQKELSWASDAHDIIDWASLISSSLLFRDVSHTFDCEDCRSPDGFTSGHRLMCITSSALHFDPELPDAHTSESHPRLDVPLVRVNVEGRSWDGFREWVPESCLWGAAVDDLRSTRRFFERRTKCIATSDGSDRAVAVLQMCLEIPNSSMLYGAHLLVGLAECRKNCHVGEVAWSKRFWPVHPHQMWSVFNRLYLNNGDAEALSDMAIIIGASSGLDYTDIANATEVTNVNLKLVKW